MPIIRPKNTDPNVPGGAIEPEAGSPPINPSNTESTEGLGSITGFKKVFDGSTEKIIPTELNSVGKVRENTTLSVTTDDFKYGIPAGLDSNRENFKASFDYEDPTFLGFEIVFLRDTSPLFTNNTTRNSALNFISKYGEEASNNTISKRKDYLNKFISTFNKIFKYDTNNGNFVKSKVYYIQNISGVDKLNAKIVNYMEDKLTITLNEDVSMLALYIAELYNNLAYDYKNQRNMIPINCLRFDMKIRVTDLRNFKIPKANDNNILSGELSKTVLSSHVYILRDCNFNFYNSQNHTENLSIAGDKVETASLTFDIFYKSVEREIQPFLINSTYGINNKTSSGKGETTEAGFNDNKDLSFKLPPSIASTKSAVVNSRGNISDIEGLVNLNISKNKILKRQEVENMLGITDFKAVINKGKDIVEDLTAENFQNFVRQKSLQIAARARNMLFNLAISEIKEAANKAVPFPQPQNVYLDDVLKTNELLAKKVGENLIGNQIPTSWAELKNIGIGKGLNTIQGL